MMIDDDEHLNNLMVKLLESIRKPIEFLWGERYKKSLMMFLMYSITQAFNECNKCDSPMERRKVFEISIEDIANKYNLIFNVLKAINENEPRKNKRDIFN